MVKETYMCILDIFLKMIYTLIMVNGKRWVGLNL